MNLHEYLLSSKFSFGFEPSNIQMMHQNYEEIEKKLQRTAITKNSEVRQFVKFCDDYAKIFDAIYSTDAAYHARIESSVEMLMEELVDLFSIKFNSLIKKL